MTHEPTTTDIMNALTGLTGRIDGLTNDVAELAEAVSELSTNTDARFDRSDSRLSNIETVLPTLVTKDYLDEKLADLRGDLVILARQQDKKTNVLVDTLTAKRILDAGDRRRIMSAGPFPETR